MTDHTPTDILSPDLVSDTRDPSSGGQSMVGYRAALRDALHGQSGEICLAQILQMVLHGLPVDADTYPDVAKLTDYDTDRFCIRHSALHFAKTAGQLAAIAEAADHGMHLEREKLAKIATAGMINALKLAGEIGMSAREISGMVAQKLTR